MKITKEEIEQALEQAFEKAYADIGSTAFKVVIDELYKTLNKK